MSVEPSLSSLSPSLHSALRENACSFLTCCKMVIALVKRTPLHQLFVVTLIGVGSGVYIYKPLLEKYTSDRDSKKKKEAVSTAVISDSDEVKTAASPATTKTSSPAKKDVTGALLIRVKGKVDKASSE